LDHYSTGSGAIKKLSFSLERWKLWLNAIKEERFAKAVRFNIFACSTYN